MPRSAVWRKSASAPTFCLIPLLASATVLSGCWEGTTAESLATVLSTEGTAEISSGQGRSFALLGPTDHPGKGTVLRTTSGSRVVLAPLPNSVVQLEGDTTLEIVRIALTKDGNETGNDMRSRYVDLKLTSGRILATHAWGEATARFTVATAHGQLIVASNALFWVESDAARTRITCASGSVGFQPKEASSTARISSGFVAESSGTTVNVTPADADPLSQERVVEALQLEQQLRDLATRNRNLLPR